MPLDAVKSLFNSLNFTVHPKPCAEDKVQALEKQLGITFPPSYREFLLWMGENHAGIEFTSSWGPDDLVDMKTKILRAMQDMNFPVKLPDDAFVFWDNQDYAFAFMTLSKGDESPVFRYHQTLDPTNFAQTHASFADWLSEHIQAHVDKLKKMGQTW